MSREPFFAVALVVALSGSASAQGLSPEAIAQLERAAEDPGYVVSGEIRGAFSTLVAPLMQAVIGSEKPSGGNHFVRQRSGSKYDDQPEWLYNEMQVLDSHDDATRALSIYVTLRMNQANLEAPQSTTNSKLYAYELNKVPMIALGELTAFTLLTHDGTDRVSEVIWFADDKHLEIRVIDRNARGDAIPTARRLHELLAQGDLYATRERLLGYQADPEPPAEALSVTLRLVDEDDQLTPADVADLELELRNTTSDRTLVGVHVELVLDDALCTEHDAVRLRRDLTEAGGCTLELPVLKPLGPGGSQTLRATLAVADETNPWIFQQIVSGRSVQGGIGADRKPFPEVGVSLERLVRVKAEGWVQEDGAAPSGDATELHDEVVPLLDARGEGVRLGYPDLSELAGEPPGASPDLMDYYRRGDVLNCSPGDRWVRALALRAARYGPDGEQAPTPEDGGGWTDTERLFPERDVAGIVASVALFVHRAFYPKGAPDDLRFERENAEALWKRRYGFGTPPADAPPKKVFICQEHALLFGSLLRALGLPVREVNVMSQPFFLSATKPWQDAASQVWHDGGWHHWSLMGRDRTKAPYDSHRHYGRFFQAYEIWVGTARFDAGKAEIISRFNVGDHRWLWLTEEWEKSGVWEFHGYGDDDNFVQTSEPPPGSWYAPWIVYEVYSPVAALLELPDGRRVGATSAVGPEDGSAFAFVPGDPLPGVVNEVPGAHYFPEGQTLYADATDPDSGVVLKQTIVVPAALVDDGAARLTLTATGEGPYEVRRTRLDVTGEVREFRGVSGVVTPGDVVEVASDEFVLHEVRPAFSEPGGDDGDDGAPVRPDPIDEDTTAADGTTGAGGEDVAAAGGAGGDVAGVAGGDVAGVGPDASSGAQATDGTTTSPTEPAADERRIALEDVSLVVPDGWDVESSTRSGWISARAPGGRGEALHVVLTSRRLAPLEDLQEFTESRVADLADYGLRPVVPAGQAGVIDGAPSVTTPMAHRPEQLTAQDRRQIQARRMEDRMDRALGGAPPTALPDPPPATVWLVTLVHDGRGIQLQVRLPSADRDGTVQAIVDSLQLH